MFVGFGVMWVGPRRSDGNARTKRYCGAGWMFRRPKWGVSRGKKLSSATEDRSSDDNPPSYTDASTQSSFEGLPKIAAKFDPHDFDLGELVKQFRDERSRERPERGSRASEMSHEGSGIANKE
ncbi:MAG: hypothetical protein CL912_19195 [Deltaproteobacteria bacterium]|nr:hypothetical protein [Deltaproteobacteria bacterium]